MGRVPRPVALSAACLTSFVVSTGCKTAYEPPGATTDAGSTRIVADVASGLDLGSLADREGKEAIGGPASEAGAQSSGVAVDLGSVNDNVPFSPTGQKVASTAWRTWIYTDVGPNRTRFGYLRVGAVVDYRGPVIKNGGCDEGWVRVNPRGFVCLGKGATLDLATPILAQASIRPKRGDGHPYLYALAGDEPPHFFFQLPSTAQARRIEGRDPVSRFEQWRLLKVASNPQVAALIGTPEADVSFLDGQGRLIKPYGVIHRLEEKVHSGRAAADSGFAIARIVEHEKRWYGMTTEHDFVALDRLRIALPSALRGIEIPSDASLPVGIVNREQLARFERNSSSNLVAVGALPKRHGVLLTGKTLPGGIMETRDGYWVAAEGLTIIPARKEYPSFATGDRKWLDLSILRQTLVAYVGQKPVYATLISSGRGGMGDPETEFATPRGTFMVYAKHVSATMDGEDDATDSYSLLDVPFVQYFHKGFALHGTYWHDEFGKVRSHGCVNLSAYDAAWLFEWTDPQVFSDWHGVINKDRGTVVHIHG